MQHIAISGELGSGKSSVARVLGARLGMEVIGSGDVQRSIAASMGLSTLQMNWLAEEKAEIDQKIDGALIEIGETGKPAILDARLAWHFVPSSFKVHLTVDPEIGGGRLLKGRYSAVEEYETLEDARNAAEARYQSEKKRFLKKYGVDISRLKNYDVVIDASDASPEDVADEILAVMEREERGGPTLRVSPRRVVPAGNYLGEIAWSEESDDSEDAKRPTETVPGAVPEVVYARPFYFLLREPRELSRAVREGRDLLPVHLTAEGGEPLGDGLSAEAYLRGEAKPSWIDSWGDSHGVSFYSFLKWRADLSGDGDGDGGEPA